MSQNGPITHAVYPLRAMGWIMVNTFRIQFESGNNLQYGRVSNENGEFCGWFQFHILWFLRPWMVFKWSHVKKTWDLPQTVLSFVPWDDQMKVEDSLKSWASWVFQIVCFCFSRVHKLHRVVIRHILGHFTRKKCFGFSVKMILKFLCFDYSTICLS